MFWRVNYQVKPTLKCMRVLPEILNERQHFNPVRFVRGFLFKLGYFIYWLNLFFEQLGLPTRLSDYGLGETDIEIIITQLKSHNLTQLGEHKNVSLEISRQILEMSI